MDILSIPFHLLLNIETSEKVDYVFQMKECPEIHNHLGTLHACAQLALAEATSGEYLQKEFDEIKDEVIPVIRHTDVKYSMPANGTLYSKASFSSGKKETYLQQFKSRQRCIIPLKIEVFNEEGKKTLTAVFDWFISTRE